MRQSKAKTIECVEEPGQRAYEHHRSSFLHVTEYGCRDARDAAEACLVEIAHRDAFETVADGDTLVCCHEVARMNALQLRNVFDGRSPEDADGENRK